jgi:hypothetical protein
MTFTDGAWRTRYGVNDRVTVGFGSYERKDHAAFAVNVGVGILHAVGMCNTPGPVNAVGPMHERDQEQVGARPRCCVCFCVCACVRMCVCA